MSKVRRAHTNPWRNENTPRIRQIIEQFNGEYTYHERPGWLYYGDTHIRFPEPLPLEIVHEMYNMRHPIKTNNCYEFVGMISDAFDRWCTDDLPDVFITIDEEQVIKP